MITMNKKADITHPWRTPEFAAKLRREFCMKQLTLILELVDNVANFCRDSVVSQYFP